MRSELAFAALFAFGLSFPLAAHAQVFKCVDAAGKVVYSQSPCPAAAKSRSLGSTPPAAPESSAAAPDPKAGAKGAPKAASTNPADQELEFRKRQQERAEAEKKANEQTAMAKTAQENCARARQQAAQYAPGSRVSSTNAQGERSFLDDAQIAQERKKAEAAVAAICK